MKQLEKMNLRTLFGTYGNLIQLDPGSLKRPYVALMMDVIGRGLEAASQVDDRIQREVSRFPEEFIFEMRALPDGPSFAMSKVGRSGLRYLGSESTREPDVSLKFKHIEHAFLVMSFQEGTARAFANDRLLLDGDTAYAIRLVRCLNRMESLILPKFVAVKALKRYPDLSVLEKMMGGGRIYSRLAKNLVWK